MPRDERDGYEKQQALCRAGLGTIAAGMGPARQTRKQSIFSIPEHEARSLGREAAYFARLWPRGVPSWCMRCVYAIAVVLCLIFLV